MRKAVIVSTVAIITLTQSIAPNESMGLFTSVSKTMSAMGTIGAHHRLSVRPLHRSKVKKPMLAAE